MMAAAFLKTPELALDDAEAKRMETAMKKVARHYPLAVTQKQVDTAYFISTIAEIYGTRAVAIYTNRTAAPVQRAPENVFTFGSQNAG